MPINLSVKRVPDEIVNNIKERAKRNHRSLQGELLTILEDAVSSNSLNVEQISHRIRRMGLQTKDESTQMIRRERDAR